MGLFSSALDFGLGRANAALDAKIQRGLRRTVYQDQMHSMRAAGLNPILAAGATPQMGSSPGTSTPGSDVESDAKTLYMAKAEREAIQANARKAVADADTAELLRESQKRLLDAQVRDTGSSADLKEMDKTFRPDFNKLTNEMLDAKRSNIQAGTDTLKKQLGLTDLEIAQAQQGLDANVPAAQAGSLRASGEASHAAAGASRASASLSGAKQALEEARTDNQLSENQLARVMADFAKEHPDLIKNGMFIDEIADRAGPIIQLFIKSKRTGQPMPDIRTRTTDAHGSRKIPTREQQEHDYRGGRAPYPY